MRQKAQFAKNSPGDLHYIKLKKFNLDPDNILAPLKGRLLIASPFLEDPYFSRTLVILCDHNEEGSFGFVLNRYIELDLPDLLENLPETAGRISLGGPVENNSLYYIHTLGDLIPESVHIGGNLYLGGDFKIISEGIENETIDSSKVRFFVGYSGWSETQLEDEIEERSWYVRDLQDLPVMDTVRDDLWNEALKGMGKPFANLAHFPADPKLN
jgi:putative transcriptional regulator